MPVTNYYSVGGEILGEETGGVRRDYLTDALGSVTGTVTSAGAIENTYRYKPYGAQLSKTGSAADPAFTWVGKWGYQQTAKTYSDVYVRARNYASKIGVFISLDPLFYREISFKEGYIYLNPVNLIDYSGLKFADTCCCCAGSISIAGNIIDSISWDSSHRRIVGAGHDFTVKYVANYKKVARPSPCKLEWWEKTNDPVYGPINPGEWVDLLNDRRFIGYLWMMNRDWKRQSIVCPNDGRSEKTIESIGQDFPQSSPDRGDRTLCIEVVMKSSPRCRCRREKASFSLVQTIKWTPFSLEIKFPMAINSYCSGRRS